MSESSRTTEKATTQCSEIIFVRDTYRYTGRGKSGFEMHYTERQCSRRAYKGGYCRQHARIHGVIR